MDVWNTAVKQEVEGVEVCFPISASRNSSSPTPSNHPRQLANKGQLSEALQKFESSFNLVSGNDALSASAPGRALAGRTLSFIGNVHTLQGEYGPHPGRDPALHDDGRPALRGPAGDLKAVYNIYI